MDDGLGVVRLKSEDRSLKLFEDLKMRVFEDLTLFWKYFEGLTMNYELDLAI